MKLITNKSFCFIPKNIPKSLNRGGKEVRSGTTSPKTLSPVVRVGVCEAVKRRAASCQPNRTQPALHVRCVAGLCVAGCAAGSLRVSARFRSVESSTSEILHPLRELHSRLQPIEFVPLRIMVGPFLLLEDPSRVQIDFCIWQNTERR